MTSPDPPIPPTADAPEEPANPARPLARSARAGAGEALHAALIERIAARDEVAFERLYRLAAPRIFGLCVFMLKDRGEAEDVLQDTFVSVWRNAASFDPRRASAQTWLSTIARNRSIDRLRARRPADGGEEALAALVDTRPDPEDDALRSDSFRRLWACVDTLGDQLRPILLGAYFGGHTVKEMAKALKIPHGTAKSRMRLALARLKACLEE